MPPRSPPKSKVGGQLHIRGKAKARSKSINISRSPSAQSASNEPPTASSSASKRSRARRRKGAASVSEKLHGELSPAPHLDPNANFIDLTADDSDDEIDFTIEDNDADVGESSRVGSKTSGTSIGEGSRLNGKETFNPLFRSAMLDLKGKSRAESPAPSPIAIQQPDTTPSIRYTPSAFTPLHRSVLSGITKQLSPSPSPPPSQPPPPPSLSLESRTNEAEHDPKVMNMAETDVIVSVITEVGTDEAEDDATEVTVGVDITEAGNTSTLLLPSHVILATPRREGERNREEDDDDDEVMSEVEGVHVVDDERSRGVPRYFIPSEPETEEAAFLASADQSKICRNCKRPGHKEVDCPHIICTTCGKEDEHERKDCPMGMVCFGCGKRGHRKQDCPDPVSRSSRNKGCNRCGVWDHMENSCPLIWRVYIYRKVADREAAQAAKDSSKSWAREAIGGDPDERWCYNCAKEGHLGDDCDLRRGSLARAVNMSAFSDRTASRGPYASAHSGVRRTGESRSSRSFLSTPVGSGRHTRFDENSTSGADSPLPYVAPGFQGHGAGRKTRELERERLRDRERDAYSRDRRDNYGSHDSGRDDWFDRRPWDSDRRARRDHRERSPIRGEYRDRDNRRRGNADEGDRDSSGNRKAASRTHDRRESGRDREWDRDRDYRESRDRREPHSAPAKGIVFGKLGLPPAQSPRRGVIDSPSISIRGASTSGRGTSALLHRALGREAPQGSHSPRSEGHLDRRGSASPAPRGGQLVSLPLPSKPNSTASSPGPSGSGGGEESKSARRKAAKRAREDETQERDWERDWRATGGGGGNVAGWGEEMDREIKAGGGGRGRLKDDRVKAGPVKGNSMSKPTVKGQRYTGGY